MPSVRLHGRQSSYPQAGLVLAEWVWCSTKHGIEVDGDCIWLLDAGGQRQLLRSDGDAVTRFWAAGSSVEGGLLNFDLDAAEWRERLIALGFEPH